MEILETKNLTFTYPGMTVPALKDISLRAETGGFYVLCGPSGGGKTTLLKLWKSDLAPKGEQTGEILFKGKRPDTLDLRERSCGIGFVMQNPDVQIVTDEVWHELAFGLENLGVPSTEIRTRVGEMANFFGITSWYREKTAVLSGGQKQLLNLAAVMVMDPEVILLDEPTAQLDPIAADHFISTLFRINRELGVTVVISEHRLQELFPLADRVWYLDGGRLAADGTPREICPQMAEYGALDALPAAAQVFLRTKGRGECPMSVREGRKWMETTFSPASEKCAESAGAETAEGAAVAMELKDVWFRYERKTPDVLSGFSAAFNEGRLTAILGGNGCGKTTAMMVMAGVLHPYKGVVKWFGKRPDQYKSGDRHRSMVSYLPQAPGLVFLKDTVLDDWKLMLRDTDRKGKADEIIRALAEEIGVPEDLWGRHPADLSGGELQKCALVKILLGEPRILLLDEPTKGLDSRSKAQLSELLTGLKSRGLTVVMVSHDVEFCAKAADTCMLAFDGKLTEGISPKRFFSTNRFYTTAAARISRGWFEDCVTPEDLAEELGRKERLHDGS